MHEITLGFDTDEDFNNWWSKIDHQLFVDANVTVTVENPITLSLVAENSDMEEVKCSE